MNTKLESFLPEHMQDEMKLYLEHGVKPGGFLYSVLTNNLSEATGRADHISLEYLSNIVSFCWNEIPSTAWGSEEKVRDYMESFKDGSNNIGAD